MSNANDLLTKSSYCRNSKHAKCKTAGCECKCHAAVAPEPTDELAARRPKMVGNDPAPQDSPTVEQVVEDLDAAEIAAVRENGSEFPGYDTEAEEDAAIAAVGGIDPSLPDEEHVDDAEPTQFADIKLSAAEQLISDRLDPAKAPAPAPKPAKKAKAAKAPKEPKPVVKGTVDGKLSNAHKRAIRLQMVTYLNAMPVDLQGDLEGVTPDEAAAYVDTYWVKYIDPARDKARHAK